MLYFLLVCFMHEEFVVESFSICYQLIVFAEKPPRLVLLRSTVRRDVGPFGSGWSCGRKERDGARRGSSSAALEKAVEGGAIPEICYSATLMRWGPRMGGGWNPSTSYPPLIARRKSQVRITSPQLHRPFLVYYVKGLHGYFESIYRYIPYTIPIHRISYTCIFHIMQVEESKTRWWSFICPGAEAFQPTGIGHVHSHSHKDIIVSEVLCVSATPHCCCEHDQRLLVEMPRLLNK